MSQREYLFWWLVNAVIAIVTSLVCLPYAHGRAPRYTIGDTVSVGGSGAYDLAGECLKFAESADADTYLCRSSADEVTLTCGAAAVWVCNASGCDLAGELGSVTSLDATTETTIEAAIDTLGDISVGSIAQGDDKSVCQGADTDFCCEWDTDGTEGLLCTATDCDDIGTDCNPLHLYQDSGNLIADLKGIDSVTNSSQKITIGPPQSSLHSLSGGSLHVTRDLEVWRYFYLDGDMNFKSNVDWLIGTGNNQAVMRVGTAQTLDALIIEPTANSNRILIVGSGDRFTNFDHDKPNDPTLTGHSDDQTDLSQYYELSWNRLALGGNGGGLGCINQTFDYTDFTDDGGASGHLDLDEQIPIGAVVQQMILHSLTGFTGDTTAVLTAGDDGGVDVDRYHSAGTLNVVASAAAGVDCGAPSGTLFHVVAVTVRLVLTGAADFGNFSAGEATISICYWTP